MASVLQAPRSAQFQQGMPQDYDYTYQNLQGLAPPPEPATNLHASYDGAGAESGLFRYSYDEPQISGTASCPPDGPSFDADFEAEFAAASSALATSSATDGSFSASTFSFPTLPASLFDDTPVYEFSSHTRTNVFEAPFDYFNDEDAARTYGLDDHDQSLIAAQEGAGNLIDLVAAQSQPRDAHQLGQYAEQVYPLGRMDPFSSSLDPSSQYVVDAPDSAASLSVRTLAEERSSPLAAHSAPYSKASHRVPPPPAYNTASTPANSERLSISGTSTDAPLVSGAVDYGYAPASSVNGFPNTNFSADTLGEPSRGPLKRRRESFSAHSTPLQSGPDTKSAPYPLRNSSGSLASSQQHFHASSTDAEALVRKQAVKPSARDSGVVVQSQGRGRMSSWQDPRANPGEPEWSSSMHGGSNDGYPPNIQPLGGAPRAMSFSAGGSGLASDPQPYDMNYHATPLQSQPGVPYTGMNGGGALGVEGANEMVTAQRMAALAEANVVSTGIGAGPGPNASAGQNLGASHPHMHPHPHPHSSIHHHRASLPMSHSHQSSFPAMPYQSSFEANNLATQHQINAIGSALEASIDSQGIARCPVPNCNKTFAKNRSYNLKAHLRSHSQLKPYQCSVCPRAFSRKHDLERHARVHSGDKPYVCEICGKGFPRSDALRRHWRVEKECGEKSALLEAGQALPEVSGSSETHQHHLDEGNQSGAIMNGNHGRHDHGLAQGPPQRWDDPDFHLKIEQDMKRRRRDF
ncbi:hypothetical protein IE53DRAFT_363482 [Violaceomyces palustris]|uniref:Uncharacterized protein n=1 Tax=Violaceomyces palustris TaxID=1673888 RepID=A0ACD0NT29_9BASI|nr:hypothetical protein IE53DRAFT_363482 [Violaceomyces palustris]